MKRRVCYVTGTRADFGLFRRALDLASRCELLDVSVCVTGMHLSPLHGSTVGEIVATGIRIAGTVPVDAETATGGAMARSIGQQVVGMTRIFEREKPDLVLVLGDRGEMLAGTIAAIHLSIPVAHVHGGERSGTIDESVRHAISKLAHYHFVATTASRERLIRMGETAEHIFVTGAPGLDGILEEVTADRNTLCQEAGFDEAGLVGLVVFHPVLQEQEQAGAQTRVLLDAVKETGIQAIWLLPNADAGGAAIRDVLLGLPSAPWLRIETHLGRSRYLSWVAAADLILGNSSSAIIEAASLGCVAVNVGSRQNARERSGNVIDTPLEANQLRDAIYAALEMRDRRFENVYGDGKASERLVRLLQTIDLSKTVLEKSNAY